MISRLYVGLLCSIVSIWLGGCLKPPNEWLGIPFVPEAYRVRWAAGYWYTAPVSVEEAVAWYQEKLGEAGWSVPDVSPSALRAGIFDICARRGEEDMVIQFIGGRGEKRTHIVIQNTESMQRRRLQLGNGLKW